jgi:hypothetical protein
MSRDFYIPGILIIFTYNLKQTEMQCSICDQEIKGKVVIDKNGNPFVPWDGGNNAQPVNDGRCCDECNYSVVIPARLGLLDYTKLDSYVPPVEE